jgi:tetratricopeptide (TPR) repeat protein
VRRLGSIVLAWTICVSCPLMADGRGPPLIERDPDREIARRHYERGRAAYERGDYQSAVDEFEAARRVMPRPALDFDVGRAYDRLERIDEAITAYERCLAAEPNSPSASELSQRVLVLRARRHANERPSPRRWLAPGLVLGAAVAVATVGAGLLGSVKPDYDQLVMECPGFCPPNRYEGLQARADAGYAMLAVAGAIAVVDLALWGVAARRGRPTR